MRSFFAAFITSALFLQAHATPVPEPSAHQSRQDCGFPTVALLRAYSPSETDHFYTTSASELEAAVASDGYVSEGDAAQVFPGATPNAVPFYRLYSSGAGDHFYTTSVDELASATGEGYTYEGIQAYVFQSSLCGAVPFYRLDNPEVGDHFYTTDLAERANAIANLGYVDEGIAAYVNSQ